MKINKREFITVTDRPIPNRKARNRRPNKYELHLQTMEVGHAVEGQNLNDVQQWYTAAKKLGYKVTAQVDPDRRYLGDWSPRYHTVWRIK